MTIRINKLGVASVLAVALLLFTAFFTSTTARNEDFIFFDLIVDGKVPKEKIVTHCAGRPTGFSVVAENQSHDQDMAMVQYSATQVANINASPGEWTGAVYKPLCPGQYTFTIDYIASDDDGANAKAVSVELYQRKRNGDRPGQLVAIAALTDARKGGAGHATVMLEMATGDELYTYSRAEGNAKRHFIRVQLSGYKVNDMPDIAADWDNEAWDAELAATGYDLNR